MAVKLSIEIIQNSQSVANNTSNVTVNVNYSWTGGSYSHVSRTRYVTIDGTKYSFNDAKINPNKTTTGSGTLFSKTLNIAHKTDGSKTLNCYASVETGGESGTVTASASKVLTTIPRATVPTVSASSIDMGQSITINMPRASSAFDHKLKYKFGDATGTIGTDLGTSKAWTVPLELASQIPSSTSGTCTITCETYNGTTLIGTKTVAFKAKVPTDIKPVISGIDIAEAVQAVTDKFGSRYVKTLSQLAVQIVVNTDNAYGATVKNYTTKIDGINYLGQQFTSNALMTSGTLTIAAAITDSRGRTSSFSLNITVFDYATPAVDIALAVSGTTVTVTITGKVYDVDSANTKALVLKYKKITDETFTERAITLNEWEFTKTETVENIDPEITYEFVAVLTDKVATTEKTATTGIITISRMAGGKGVTFGGEAEQDGFVCKWPAQFDSGLTAGAELDMTADEIAEINTSIGTTGSRLANFLKSIALKLGLIADYVVEQGTSDNWTYRKWNSGISECWGTHNPSAAASGTEGGLYFQSLYIDFPSGLFASAPRTLVTAHGNWIGGAMTGNALTATTWQGYRWTPTSQTNTSALRIELYCIGTWK